MILQPTKIQVRFADLDVMGHVNNSIYFTYFEYARVDYFGRMLGYDWDWTKDGVLLVKNVCEYHKPVVLIDQPEIELFLKSVGTKSFELSYELKVRGEIYTTGSSTLVCFNGESQQTIPIPDQMRKSLELLKKA